MMMFKALDINSNVAREYCDLHICVRDPRMELAELSGLLLDLVHRSAKLTPSLLVHRSELKILSKDRADGFKR